MVEELYQKTSCPVRESAGNDDAFPEIVCAEAEQLHLLLIMDVIWIYEIKECKCQQDCCR